jgi:hypothetical protein
MLVLLPFHAQRGSTAFFAPWDGTQRAVVGRHCQHKKERKK